MRELVTGNSNPARTARESVTANRAAVDDALKASITAALENHPALRKLKENLAYLSTRDAQSVRESITAANLATNAATQERADLVAKIVGAGVFSKEVAETLPLAALKQLTANAALMAGHPVINRDLVGSVADNYRAATLPGEEVAQSGSPASLLGGSTDTGSFLANLQAAGGDK